MDKEFWKFFNTFAPWLSAIGTLAAVLVSLYLARINARMNKIKLRASVGHRLIMDTGKTGPHEEIINFQVTNIGQREANITTIAWRVGFIRKSQAIQMFDNSRFANELPVLLRDGKQAGWMISLTENEGWLTDFCKSLLFPHWRLNIGFVRLQVHTSIGKVFETKIEQNLKEKLVQECKKIERE
jgi:hypothetical protein